MVGEVRRQGRVGGDSKGFSASLHWDLSFSFVSLDCFLGAPILFGYMPHPYFSFLNSNFFIVTLRISQAKKKK